MEMTTAPDRTEAADYYFTYIDQVSGTDIVRILREQAAATVALLRGIADDRSRHRYAEGKWSIREVLSHVNDAERVFVFRAFWFARGYESALPGFDQDVAVAHAGADTRSWPNLIDEFQPCAARRCRCSRRCPPRPGCGAGSPARRRSPFARWPSSLPDTLRTTCGSCASGICRTRRTSGPSPPGPC